MSGAGAGTGAEGRLRVAALQLGSRPGELAANREHLARAVRELGDGMDLVVAPELASTGYDLELIRRRGPELAEPLDGPTVELTAELAAETGATIVVGMLERSGDELYDTAAVVGPDGPVTAYRKTHLYPPETEALVPGDRLVTVPLAFDARGVRAELGVMICFEHAFPEIATALALQGATVVAIPSAVPFGYEHLLVLRTRARAQDNQVFVVAANLATEVFCGGSMIVGPRGEVLASAGTGMATIRACIDLGAVLEERRREPALRLRRPELYPGRADAAPGS